MFPRGPLIQTGQESTEDDSINVENYLPVTDVVDALKDLTSFVANDLSFISESTSNFLSNLNNTFFHSMEEDRFFSAFDADDATPDENACLLKQVSGYGSFSNAQHRFISKESKNIHTKPTNPIAPPKSYGNS